jgi:two-component system sensor histidine kinase CpxA
MRALYLRIFIAFWAAMVLTLVASVLGTLWLADQRLQHEQSHLDELASAASVVLARDGVPGLRKWLESESARAAPDRLYILDHLGDDLLGRRVPEFLRARFGRPDRGPHGPPPGKPGPPGGLPPPALFPDLPPDARDVRWISPLVSPGNAETYALSLLRARRGPFGLFRAEAPVITGLVTLLVSAVLCFLLARWLSAPIRHLRAATHSIAAGDLGVRVSSLMGDRRDELALLALDFDRMAERLRALLASHRELLRDVSHELRSPLARLQLALGLARRPNANLSQEFDRIEQEAARLDALIGEILSLSRLDDPARVLQWERFDLHELLETLVEHARIEADARGIELQLPANGPLQIEADRELLFRALDNVLRNAVRFSPDAGCVEIATIPESGSQVCIRIRDHGPGVPSEALERIFEPFVTVSTARDRAAGGSGIGLAITARVVALHHGKVSARAAEGGGMCVELRLPLRRVYVSLATPRAG